MSEQAQRLAQVVSVFNVGAAAAPAPAASARRPCRVCARACGSPRAGGGESSSGSGQSASARRSHANTAPVAACQGGRYHGHSVCNGRRLGSFLKHYGPGRGGGARGVP